MKTIPRWLVSISDEQLAFAASCIRERRFSLGEVVALLETKLEGFFGRDSHVVMCTNGTAALTMSLMAIGVGPGDEVLVPDRTWIATAHAVRVLGAEVVVGDCRGDLPVLDVGRLASKITNKTRAVIPVYLNGRSIPGFNQFRTKLKELGVISVGDCAQAIGSVDEEGRMVGSADLISCYSLSMAKLLGSGQGGFCVTRDADIAAKLRSIRTHGVETVDEPGEWVGLGFNFRFTDIQAALVVGQLDDLPRRIFSSCDIYRRYENGLRDISGVNLIPVEVDRGEVSTYIEVLVDNRELLQTQLRFRGIETRKFYPDISSARYLNTQCQSYRAPSRWAQNGLYLPSGPDQSMENVDFVIDAIRSSI